MLSRYWGGSEGAQKQGGRKPLRFFDLLLIGFPEPRSVNPQVPGSSPGRGARTSAVSKSPAFMVGLFAFLALLLVRLHCVQRLDDGFLKFHRFILVYLMPGMLKEHQPFSWRLQGVEIRLRDPGRGLDVVLADEKIHGAVNAFQGLGQINVHDLVPYGRPGF